MLLRAFWNSLKKLFNSPSLKSWATSFWTWLDVSALALWALTVWMPQVNGLSLSDIVWMPTTEGASITAALLMLVIWMKTLFYLRGYEQTGLLVQVRAAAMASLGDGHEGEGCATVVSRC